MGAPPCSHGWAIMASSSVCRRMNGRCCWSLGATTEGRCINCGQAATLKKRYNVCRTCFPKWLAREHQEGRQPWGPCPCSMFVGSGEQPGDVAPQDARPEQGIIKEIAELHIMIYDLHDEVRMLTHDLRQLWRHVQQERRESGGGDDQRRHGWSGDREGGGTSSTTPWDTPEEAGTSWTTTWETPWSDRWEEPTNQWQEAAGSSWATSWKTTDPWSGTEPTCGSAANR